MLRVARIGLNLLLVLAGLAVVVVVGTGGATLSALGGSLGLNHLANPVLVLAVAGALRLGLANPDAGPEGWVCRQARARGGLLAAGRPAGAASAVRASLLLAGAGLVGGLVDGLQVVIHHPDVAPGLSHATQLVSVSVALWVALAWPLGLVLSFLLLFAARATGARPSSYRLGRMLVLVGMPLAGAAVALSRPEWEAHAAPVGISPLTLVPLLSVLVGTAVFLGIPAVVLRVRQGKGGPVLAVVIALVFLAAVSHMVTRDAPRPAAPGAEARPPVLLVTVASLRADAVGTLGGPPGATPVLDALATGGAVVEEAISPIPIDLPAAYTLHIGQSPEVHGYRSAGTAYAGPAPTLAEVMRATGYRTAAFVGSDRLRASTSGLGRGFDHFDDHLGLRAGIARLAVVRTLGAHGLLSDRGIARAPRSRPGAEVVERALAWIGGAGRGGWFVWVHLDEPRAPFDALRPGLVPVDGSSARAGEDRRRVASVPAVAADRTAPGLETVGDYLDAYRTAVVVVDGLVGRILEGAPVGALIVVTADHGETLGEGGLYFQADRSLSDASLRVPLIVGGKPVAPGRRVAGQASLAEVAPAVVTLVGGDLPVGDDPASLWEPTDLGALLAADTPEPSPSRVGPPVCVEARRRGVGATRVRPRGLRWAGFKLLREPGQADRLLWVGGAAERPAEVDQETSGRLALMQAELAACEVLTGSSGETLTD